MSVYLVRHGESTLNAQGVRHGAEQDPPLTEVGVKQAAEAGSQLAHLSGAVILTSPAVRAQQTAALIAEHVDYSGIHVLRGLLERSYAGRWLESCEQAATRASEALAAWSGTVIAVTHSGVLRGLLGLTETPANGSIHSWTR